MNKLMTNSSASLVYIIISITLLSGIALSSSTVSADNDEVIDTVQLTVPVACTMNGTGTTHTATLNPGTYSGASGSEYENGIGKTTLTAICNDDNGFAIYAIGFTGNSYDSENHTKLVGSNTNGTISTKAYASGDTTSNWSMKLIKVTDTSVTYNPENLTITNSFNDWHAVPDTYTKVAEYHANTGSSTTDTTLGVKLETTYAAYIASNQAADTYIGQVKYTMVHPYNNEPHDGPIANCPANKICYSPVANDIEGTMGQQSITSSATSATLLASNFSRTGYGFAGWSDVYDYNTNSNARFYGPQEDITFTAGQYSTTNGGLRLYAVWVPSQGSLQNSTKVAELCGTGDNALTTAPTDGTADLSSVSALTDQRDNETYAIAKLADGNCWMIENLRLEAEYTRGATNQALAQGYGTSATYGNFIGLADAESLEKFSSTFSANSLYSNNGSNNTINIGASNAIYRIPRYSNINTPSIASNRPQNPTTNSASNSNSDAGMYSYGNYYTWHAATASLSPNDTRNRSTTTTSLCPSNWHLPSGGRAYAPGDTSGLNVTGNTSTFRELYYLGYKIMDEVGTAYEDMPNDGYSYYYTNTLNTAGYIATKAFRKYPNNFIYSGYIDDGSVKNRGSQGYYRSSTALSSNTTYTLTLSSSSVAPGTSTSGYIKYYGLTIRCLVSGT